VFYPIKSSAAENAATQKGQKLTKVAVSLYFNDNVVQPLQ